jgi:hypothetical protein
MSTTTTLLDVEQWVRRWSDLEDDSDIRDLVKRSASAVRLFTANDLVVN